MSGKSMQVLVAVVAAGVALAAAPAGAQATASHSAMAKKATHAQGLVKVKEETAGLASQATVSADSAQKLALAQVPKGRIAEAELENEKGTLVYSYDIKTAGKSGVDEVLIDAKTGAVVSTEHESAAMEKKEAAAAKKMTKAPAAMAKKNVAKSTTTPAPKKP